MATQETNFIDHPGMYPTHHNSAKSNCLIHPPYNGLHILPAYVYQVYWERSELDSAPSTRATSHRPPPSTTTDDEYIDDLTRSQHRSHQSELSQPPPPSGLSSPRVRGGSGTHHVSWLWFSFSPVSPVSVMRTSPRKMLPKMPAESCQTVTRSCMAASESAVISLGLCVICRVAGRGGEREGTARKYTGHDHTDTGAGSSLRWQTCHSRRSHSMFGARKLCTFSRITGKVVKRHADIFQNNIIGRTFILNLVNFQYICTNFNHAAIRQYRTSK